VIAKLGLGCHTLADDSSDRERAVSAISAAFESGMMMFDAAESYGAAEARPFLGNV
jgi:aryl-alcohol dehydrogenase-like predicted oxidoreductase